MAQAAGSLLASLSAGVGVNSKFQADRMHVIGKRFDALRKTLRIGNDVAVRIARDLPTVVNHDVLIVGVLHAGFHHRVRHPTDQFVAHVAAKFVPGVPSHGRSER